MGTYYVKLLGKHDIAKDTMAFIFEKPANFVFRPGQCGDFTLVHPQETDEEGTSRAFSFASSPYEEHLMVATRIRDTAFKRCLKALPLGAEVKLDAPGGSFALHTTTSVPAVFLTGGIGITPVRSILLQAAHDQLLHRIFLFYSNTSPESAAFLQELSGLESTNPRYSFIGTMTNMGQSHQPWTGDKGHITIDLVRRYVPDLVSPIYYICGPRAMVNAMRTMLQEAAVNEDNIRTEEFSGY
jgi:ferredoxin-NADP reductase